MESAKKVFQHMVAIIKEFLQLVSHKQVMRNLSPKAERHGVMDGVPYLDAPLYGNNLMPMVPELERPGLLHINKVVRLLHMRNHGYPSRRETQWQLHP